MYMNGARLIGFSCTAWSYSSGLGTEHWHVHRWTFLHWCRQWYRTSCCFDICCRDCSLASSCLCARFVLYVLGGWLASCRWHLLWCKCRIHIGNMS
jgi:hypothetical protein